MFYTNWKEPNIPIMSFSISCPGDFIPSVLTPGMVSCIINYSNTILLSELTLALVCEHVCVGSSLCHLVYMCMLLSFVINHGFFFFLGYSQCLANLDFSHSMSVVLSMFL